MKGKPKNPGGRPPRYDWDGWFKKRSFTLKAGTHYDVSQQTMKTMIRNAAAKRGLAYDVRDNGNSITVTVGKEWVLK